MSSKALQKNIGNKQKRVYENLKRRIWKEIWKNKTIRKQTGLQDKYALEK